MKTTDRLIAAATDILNAYNSHPFVAGIQAGNLDQEKFRYYIVQDFFYLRDYAKVFAVGVAKAKQLEIMRLFAAYIPVMDGELNVHEGYLARLGVTQEELDHTKPSYANLSYTSYMLRVAYEEGAAETLVATLPCAYTYELIAHRMVEADPTCTEHPFYGQWVKSYIGPEFAASNQAHLDAIDELTAHYTEEQIDHLIDIFIMGCRYEMGFWEMSWNMAQ